MIKPFVTQFGGFPWYLEVYLVAQAVKHLPAMWETGFDPWVGKIPWRRKWQSTPVLLPGKYHCQRSLVGCSPWGCKESEITWATSLRLHSLVPQFLKNPPAMRETWVRSLGGEDPLEEEMATHSSILAWKIPWTEEPGRLQSMESHIVGHNLVTKPPRPLAFYHLINVTSYYFSNILLWKILNVQQSWKNFTVIT